VLLSDFRFNVPDLEHAFIARIRGRLDENEKPSGNQDGAQNLHNSHVIPLQRANETDRNCSRIAAAAVSEAAAEAPSNHNSAAPAASNPATTNTAAAPKRAGVQHHAYQRSVHVKIRADWAHNDYRDPGWYKAPAGSVAYLWEGETSPLDCGGS
jgi:hypothetical protein